MIAAYIGEVAVGDRVERVTDGARRAGRRERVRVVLRRVHRELQACEAAVRRLPRVPVHRRRLVLLSLDFGERGHRVARIRGAQRPRESGHPSLSEHRCRHRLLLVLGSLVLRELSDRVASLGRLCIGQVLPDAVDGENRQDADDRHDDHQLDQRKPSLCTLEHSTHCSLAFRLVSPPRNPRRPDSPTTSCRRSCSEAFRRCRDRTWPRR